ncbi:hypothetical protein [Streptomyces sp. NBC_00078]|uniref:hypothetical protein n=1 Tax=unclassified Streptomyces TaxID=2593676 RepID=UPI00225A9062|nr:hypothetical protein [Streptomyces sp. NBC_00078]MCX5424595.1 hypothetical protein [Streptomyces sp. NBC_00078]
MLTQRDAHSIFQLVPQAGFGALYRPNADSVGVQDVQAFPQDWFRFVRIEASQMERRHVVTY